MPGLSSSYRFLPGLLLGILLLASTAGATSFVCAPADVPDERLRLPVVEARLQASSSAGACARVSCCAGTAGSVQKDCSWGGVHLGDCFPRGEQEQSPALFVSRSSGSELLSLRPLARTGSNAGRLVSRNSSSGEVRGGTRRNTPIPRLSRTSVLLL